jgi:hypothetical protein
METHHAALLFSSHQRRRGVEQSRRSRLAGYAAALTNAVALARDLKGGAAMPGWDWTGWFVAIIDQHGQKVDEVPIADA